MSTILEDIESKIEELKTTTTKSNVGVVRETGDGVARIEGLSDVMLNEMVEFPNGVYGLALNLEETRSGRDPHRPCSLPSSSASPRDRSSIVLRLRPSEPLHASCRRLRR